MSVAHRARSVASTAMNAQSSRSHSVFTLWLAGTDSSTGTTLKVCLLFANTVLQNLSSDASFITIAMDSPNSSTCFVEIISMDNG